MKKKFVLVLFLMLFNMLFIVGAAEEWNEYTYMRIEDGLEITSYKGTDTKVEIPSEINGLPVKSIGNNAFDGSKIEKITLPDSVTKIGDEAFNSCFSLSEIIMSDNIEQFGVRAFFKCFALKEIYLPQRLCQIGESKYDAKHIALCFYDCNSLERIIVNKENLYYKSDDQGILYSKDGAEVLWSLKNMKGSLVIPKGVVTINNEVFAGCSGLTKVVFPETVKKLGHTAFGGCKNLKTLVFYNPDTEISGLKVESGARLGSHVYYYPTFWETPIETVYGFVGSSVEEDFRSRFIPIVKLLVNGEKIVSDQPTYIKNDRTMVPMRAIFEALNATVTWDNETRTAIGVKDGVEVKITIGENVLYKNGDAIELDCAAEITNDRTMVPVRAISEAFGCTVEWNNETKTVEITS